MMYVMGKSLRISPIIIKIAVIALILKELWLLLGIPSFADALISFLTIGAVPGTNITLSPDQMYKLVAIVGVLVTLLVFRKELTRLFWRKHDRVELPSLNTIVLPALSEAKKVKAPAMPLAPPAKTVHKHKRSYYQRLLSSERTLTLVASFTALWATTKTTFTTYYIRAKVIMNRAVRRVWTYGRLAGLVVYRLLLLAIIIAVNTAVVTWKWAKPHIHRFDAWLDKKLHANEYSAGVLGAGKEIIVTTRRAFQGIKSLVSELIKPASNDSKQD